MKVKYTREQFDNTRKLVCTKKFIFNNHTFLPGHNFPLDEKDKKACTRARQMYQMRMIDHKDNYTSGQIKDLKKASKKEKPDNTSVTITDITTTTTTV